jgi:monofunctional biosynthetic peptidoglycan transglycosylase
MERTLSKRRIFELYLNLIEWGDGVFGAEAAARHYFGVSAADLAPRQALLLAAVIINPHRYRVLDPPRRIERRVRMIASRMRRRGALDQVQYDQALGLAPPAPPPDSTAPPGDSLAAPVSPPATP